MAVANLMCRLFKPPGWQKVLLWSVAVMCNLNFALTVVMKLARCRPFLAPWNWDGGKVERTECGDYQPYLMYFLYAAGEFFFPDLDKLYVERFGKSSSFLSLFSLYEYVLCCVPSNLPS